MIKELTEIRNELLRGVEKSDLLYIKMQINKIDTLLYNASKNNYVLLVVRLNEVAYCHAGKDYRQNECDGYCPNCDHHHTD